MEAGRAYEEVLKEAQELGYAEAKPDADVEGWDALAKVVILSKSVMGVDIAVGDVDRVRGRPDDHPRPHDPDCRGDLDAGRSDDPVLKAQQQLAERLGPQFSLIRSISFANGGSD